MSPATPARALRWGLLSTAAINQALLATDPERTRFVAVASRDADRARAYAAEQRIARAHGSYEALLADPEVDAIYNPLPNGMHAEWTDRALTAGKHVLCEKPFTRRPQEVEATWDLAERRGLVVAEAFMWRHHPLARRAAALVAEGAIGELRTLHADFSFTLADPGDVRWSGALDGGALMDLGCYCVSGLRTLAGAEPVGVRGELVRGGDDVDATFAGVLRFPGDVLGTLSCSFAAARHHELVATGTTGRMVLRDPWHARTPVIELERDGGHERVEAPSEHDGYALEISDLEAAAAGERSPLLGRDDALGQARTIAALYASAATEEHAWPTT